MDGTSCHCVSHSKIRQDITSLLTEINSVLAYGAEIRMEAVGLLREMTEPSFSFIAKLVSPL